MSAETKRYDGGAAFPQDRAAPEFGKGARYTEPGMTLRDYFAGQALVGVLSASGRAGEEAFHNPDRAVVWSYEIADAMLEARAK